MFELDSKSGTVKSATTARGSSEDAKVLLTLKISVVDVRAAACAYALGADDEGAYMRAMFRPSDVDADESPVLLNATGIDCELMVENGHRIRISNLPWLNITKLYAVRVAPRSRRLSNVDFTCTIQDPPEGVLDSIARLLHSSTKVSLEQAEGASVKRGSDDRQTTMNLTNDDVGDDGDDGEAPIVGRANAVADAIQRSRGKPRSKPKRKRAAV